MSEKKGLFYFLYDRYNIGYTHDGYGGEPTNSMKTAISVPENIFSQVEEEAKSLRDQIL